MLPLLRGVGLSAGATSTLRTRPRASTTAATDFTMRHAERSSEPHEGLRPARARALRDRRRRNRRGLDPEAAELTKLLENVFRSVNIALVNEWRIADRPVGIDVWEGG